MSDNNSLSSQEDMSDVDTLIKISQKIDGNGYGAARVLMGAYIYDDGTVIAIDRVPRDPLEPLPGRIRLFIPYGLLRYNKGVIIKDRFGKLASKHFFTELCYRTLRYEGRPWLWMEPPGQAILERTSVEILKDGIELRLDFIPPYKGRRKISGGRLRRLFSETIPRIIRELTATEKKRSFLKLIRDTLEDQEVLRRKLEEEGYIAFIANGAVLPRRGDTDFPMPNAVPFEAPKEYTTEFKLPNHGPIEGLCIRMNEISVFVGANFHGKTTILEALAVAHYNHIPGDGREFVISVDELPLIMVENRRVVRGVDISGFIRILPGGPDPSNFTTNNASGSTSQAASLIEAFECGVAGVLIDEDSSAVNFILRDEYLKGIIPRDLEPITPLIDRLKDIKKRKIAVIFAVGALGEILKVADCAYVVSKYRISEVLSNKKKSLQTSYGGYSERENELAIKQRIPKPGSIPNGKVKLISFDEVTITWHGKRITVNLRGSIRRTFKEKSQVRALAYAITYASKYADGKHTLKEIVDAVISDINEYGLSIINPYHDEMIINLSMFTRYQLFYALSRLPTLRIK